MTGVCKTPLTTPIVASDGRLQRKQTNTTVLNKTGPTINRGSSKQDYQTPPDFMEAVVKRFGPISFDLAATLENKQSPSVDLGNGEWCHNFLSEHENSLDPKCNWSSIDGNLWLNPPYSDIEPWARKCSEYSNLGRILFLVPASVGSEWYARWVERKAYVLALRPRLTFVGCEDPYPRDCILAVYGSGFHGFDTWKWK